MELGRVGAGVFGTVFRAKYAGSAVAAKVIHTGRATPQFLITECKLMLTLRHPNVLTTLGLVSDNAARHAILMELMDMSLTQLLTSRQHGPGLTWKAPLVSIALQVARGMAYLHERQIIHGDLKPANVLLGGRPPDGLFVKLADFGEAKRVEQSPQGGSFSSSGAGGISKRADVWAFGGILAHLEARQGPFNPAPPMPFYYGVLKENHAELAARRAGLAPRCALGQTLALPPSSVEEGGAGFDVALLELDGVVQVGVLTGMTSSGGGRARKARRGVRATAVGGWEQAAAPSARVRRRPRHCLARCPPPRLAVSFRDCVETLTRVATAWATRSGRRRRGAPARRRPSGCHTWPRRPPQ